MRNPAKLRAIYAELRRAAGTDVSAGDLVRLAHLILRTYNAETDSVDDYGRPADSRAFCSLPVDEAMMDGGWRVLTFEAKRRYGIDDVDTQELAILKTYVTSFLGPEWQQRILRD